MSRPSEVRDLTPIHVPEDDDRRVDLREIGFIGYVSDAALAEIDRNESRANRVVTTATTFAFR